MINQVVVLYSGGSDSTLAAALVAKKYKKVRLVTYNRFGFLKTKANAKINYENLKSKFGVDKFTFEVINFDDMFKKVQYDRYPYYLKKYGQLCMSICGLCKLAMHWKTISYCLKNSINDVCDGSVKEMSVFPAQNKSIALENIKRLYKEFNINYFNPVYEKGKLVEQQLFDLKILPTKNYKMTKHDKQVVCSQQILFSNFVMSYLSNHFWKEYTQEMHNFYREKIEDIKIELKKIA